MYLLSLYPCVKFESYRKIGYGNTALQFVLCSFRYFTSVSNFKAIGQLLMEILHFEDLGDTECRLAANAVVLVLGECQISIATYLKGVSTLI